MVLKIKIIGKFKIWYWERIWILSGMVFIVMIIIMWIELFVFEENNDCFIFKWFIFKC